MSGELLLNWWLRSWLAHKNIQIKIPKWRLSSLNFGIAESGFVTWCGQNKRPYKWFIILRVLMVLNAVLAAVIFIGYGTSQPAPSSFFEDRR
jgi:hypothetical protein